MTQQTMILNVFLAISVIITLYVYINRDATDDNSKFMLILPVSSIILSIYIISYINPRVEEISLQIDNFLDGPVSSNPT